MKEWVTATIGCIGAFIASLFGGWDASLTTLCICMLVDYMTGLICATFFFKSNKSETGKLSSEACWKGLLKKGITLLIILIAYRVDLLFGSTYIRDAACICYIINEIISITENATLMGIPMPKAITRAIDILKEKEDDKTNQVGKE